MKYPRITVVTPNYNGEAFIEQTIRSVLDQNYPNLEYIIIDGNSTDKSVEIIKKYDSALSYWVSEPDLGLYDAIQKGFIRSTGDIMTYINSDDLLAPFSLFTIAEIMEEYSQIEWLTGLTAHIDEVGRNIYVGSLKRWNKYNYLNNDYQFIQQEGTFWKRTLWQRTGAFVSTQYKLASDMELWSRFFEYAELYTFPGILGLWRTRSSNQKSFESMDSYHEEAKIIISTMKCSTEELKHLQTSNSKINRALQHHRLRFLYNRLNLSTIQNKISKYPPLFSYDRVHQKFKL